MSQPIVKEVNAPYTVNPDDESPGAETIIVRRNGEPVAAVLPYAEYQSLVQTRTENLPRQPGDPEFERNRAAFYRLLPGLLKEHRGEWVAIVDEQAVEFGPTSAIVLTRVYDRLGHVRLYVQEISEQPRVYRMPSPRVIRP